MIARVLSRDEWHRLEGPDLPETHAQYWPNDLDVVVVEDGGRIVARMLVLRMPHFEGAWIAPEYRKNLGVTRALLRESARVAGGPVVLGGVVSPEMDDVMRRMGGAPLDARFYVVHVGEQRWAS